MPLVDVYSPDRDESLFHRAGRHARHHDVDQARGHGKPTSRIAMTLLVGRQAANT